jgi:uncharacterized membrane protein
VAAPVFMLLSGMTLGYVDATAPREAYDRFVSKLLERGIFLLTVAHLVILPSRLFLAPHAAALRSAEMTDTIGVCIIVGPLLVARLGRARRLLLGAALLAVSWTVIIATPDDIPTAARVVQHALFGHSGNNWWYSSFPVVPWFAVYLLGTVVGEQLLPRGKGMPDHNARVLLRWAAALVVCGVLVELAVLGAAALFPANDAVIIWGQRLANPFAKFPPSPAYLFLLAAAGLALTAVVSLCVERRLARWLMRRAQEVGRASLFIFLAQGYLYYFIEVRWLHPLPRSWPIAFAGSLVVIGVLAKLWLKFGGNSLLTLPWLFRTHHLAHAEAQRYAPPLLEPVLSGPGDGRRRPS